MLANATMGNNEKLIPRAQNSPNVHRGVCADSFGGNGFEMGASGAEIVVLVDCGGGDDVISPTPKLPIPQSWLIINQFDIGLDWKIVHDCICGFIR